jgi:hypothetical protein
VKLRRYNEQKVTGVAAEQDAAHRALSAVNGESDAIRFERDAFGMR